MPVAEHRMHSEIILSPEINRHVVFPIRFPKLWDAYKKACSSIWMADEINVSKDILDWSSKLSKPEQDFIANVLAFFAVSDGIVNENLVQRFSKEVTIPEAKHFYGTQIFMENIHAETYANLITTLIPDPRRRRILFNASSHISSIGAKASWAMKWIENEDEPFPVRLIAFAAVEGIFFSSSFAAIFWLKSRGIMPGLCYSNKLIARDEGLHTEFACLLLQYITHKPNYAKIMEIITEAVDAEKDFVKESLPVQLIGINADMMSEYVEFVADRLLELLGLEKHYNSINPFPFMEMISVDVKANFFERQVSAYSLSSMTTAESEQEDAMKNINFSTEHLQRSNKGPTDSSATLDGKVVNTL